jgi:predicted Zn-ribbon and HTH transcriptional regulator
MNMTLNNTKKCPKCSSDMIQHPSLLSMPLSSSSHSTYNMKKLNVEDQDANFIFKFKSCKHCGYAELYLTNSGNRI